MRMPRTVLLALGTALSVSLLAAPSAAAEPPKTTAEPEVAAAATEVDQSTVDPKRRGEVLPAGWESSEDLAWTTDGDSTGFHLMVAEARTGYTWRTVATLAEPWIETDRWIGNACLTASGRRAVVVYAPRHFTNRAHLFDRGAFAAVVDLSSGAVTKLDVTVSLAYYDPGCGTGETAVLTQSGAVDLGRTRLHVVDTARAAVVRRHELAGEVTSAVPVGDRVVAARGAQLVEIDPSGSVRQVAPTRGTAIHLHPDAEGGLVYLERDGGATVVKRFAGTTATELGRGPLTEVNLVAGTKGRVFVTGTPTMAKSLPGSVAHRKAPADAEVSTEGALTIVRTAQAKGAAMAAEPAVDRTVSLHAEVTATRKSVEFAVAPTARISPNAEQGLRPAPVMPTAAAPAAESSNNPVDNDRTCSIPRNDTKIQVYQPHWSQVEWAAELAVQGGLTLQRPANWKHSGMPASWRPQQMFPPIGLNGGGRVPAQILLGVLAQESNLWQASFHVAEGVTGNPLVGNFYGIEDGWGISWTNADCGYGVAQVTDGMRLAGRTKPGETALPPEQQRAVAVDYATNIAAGLRILQDKWNQVRTLGVTVNNGDPLKIENWFAALWAYNSGINPQASTGNTTGCTPGPNCTDANGYYGLGWSNNPARPDYPFNRDPFLDGDNYDDARHPQHWPYPEKVIGWAAYPIVKYTGGDGYEAGYQQAWWTSEANRTNAKPGVGQFCVPDARTGNRCNPSNIGGTANPCLLADFHCWWHSPVAWKQCGVPNNETCGRENEALSVPGDPEPPDADALGAYTEEQRNRFRPNCALDGLPSGTLVVDNVPNDVPSVRANCARPASNGTFGLSFAQHSDGLFHSKVDFHQIGGGFGGHFWFTHTRTSGANATKSWAVTGSWTLNRSLNQWARVLVHMPDHGAHTQQATYTVDLGNGRTKQRTVLQKTQEHRWVSLGAFQFAGTPTVSLSSINAEGDGTQDVAFDAVAFQPLPGKPAEQMVVLGDSYASGDGASRDARVDYYQETDDSGTGGSAYRNGCHRSKHAWSRQATLPGTTQSVGARADGLDPSMDYHLLACSGAQTEHLLPGNVANAWGETGVGKHKELSQMDRGFLDENTTTVALSVGGNDAHFSDVMRKCTVETPDPTDATCMNETTPREWFSDQSLPLMPLPTGLPYLVKTDVKNSVETVLRQVHSRAPNAKIVLVGYPHLFPVVGDGTTWHRNVACMVTTGLVDAEIDFLNDMSDVLNLVLHSIAVRMTNEGIPVLYSDPRDEFELENACSSGEANDETIHRIILTRTEGEDPSGIIPLGSQQSFHPKISGARNYADAYANTLRTVRDGTGMPAPPSKEVAAAELYELRAYPPGSSTGYDRTLFWPTPTKDWANFPGAYCDTREMVLRRNGSALAPASGCKVTAGSWHSPYDNTSTTVSSDVHIDHMVPLKNAWISGASNWTPEVRLTFANDLEHPQLIAVSKSSNTSKGERSPDAWMPSETAYHCTYVRAWIHTKRVYHLSVTDTEYAELKRLLAASC
jgi:hypothetical protein